MRPRAAGDSLDVVVLVVGLYEPFAMEMMTVFKTLRWLVCVAVAWMVFDRQSLPAQEKQAVVVSLSGIGKIVGDLDYLARQTGNPQFGGALQIANLFTQGIDPKRPAGVMISFPTPAPKPRIVGFVPVTDFAGLLKRVEPQFGEPKDEGNGVRSLRPQGTPVFFKEQQEGWVFLSDAAEALVNVPKDPLSVLGGMEKEYNVGVKLNIQNVPQALRENALQEITRGMEAALQQGGNGNAEASKRMQEDMMKQFTSFLLEGDQIAFGWQVDMAGKKTYLDFAMTAVEGSTLARQAAALKQLTTNFAGFTVPDAAVTLQSTQNIPPEQAQQTIAQLGPLRAQLEKQINDDGNMSAADRAKAKQLVERLFGILTETIKSGKIDGGASLVLKPKQLTLAGGLRVADGAKCDQLFRELVEASKQDPKAPKVQMNAAKHGDVTFHKLIGTLPADNAEARRIFGDTIEAYFGVGRQAVYLGIGQGGLEAVKKGIDSASQSKPAQPMLMQISFGPIIKFAAEANPQAEALLKDVANRVDQLGGSDKIMIQLQGIDRGSRFRLELQEGALQVIGQIVAAARGARS